MATLTDTYKTTRLVGLLTRFAGHTTDDASLEALDKFLSSEDTTYQFENSNYETYVLTVEDGDCWLGYPEKDYTGDPDVVARFNYFVRVA